MQSKNLWITFILFMVLISVPWKAKVHAGTNHQDETTPFDYQVIELTNAERLAQGLPPLAYNIELTNAAQGHTQTMAMNGFLDHTDQLTGSTPADRVLAAGYNYQFTAENIAAGYDTPEEAVEGWMNSDGHRANILSTNNREIGVGYFRVDEDPNNYFAYWTQNFGARSDYYPIIINNEAYSTTNSTVDLYIYGAEVDATEMRFSIDNQGFSDWEPFISQTQQVLPSTNGTHTIAVEIRNAVSNTWQATDTIILMVDSTTQTNTSTIITSTPVAAANEGNLAATSTPNSPIITPTSIANITPNDPSIQNGSEGFVTGVSTIQEPKSGFEEFRCLAWEEDFSGLPFWLAIVFIAIVILIIINLLFRLLSGRWWMRGLKSCGLRCQIFRWAFLIYLIFLAGLAANMTGGLCEQSGTYIWRVDNTHQAEILSIDADHPESIYEINGLENDTCVGCHTYTDDARLMAFVQGGLNGQVMLYDGNQETSEPLVINGELITSSYIEFSPDGTRLAIARDDIDIYVYDLDTGDFTPIVNDPNYVETMPVWGRNGEYLYYVRSEQPSSDSAIIRTPTDIYRYRFVNGETEPVEQASEPNIFEYYPAISPSGNWLVFTRHQNINTYADPAAALWATDLNTNSRATRVADQSSWANYSGELNWLAYRSTHIDNASDIIIRQVSSDGINTQSFALEGANETGVFEHLPARWTIPAPLTWDDIISAMLPWLLPIPFLYLLAMLWCYPLVVFEEDEDEDVVVVTMRRPLPIPDPPPVRKRPIWEPKPALIIGFGHAGRWTLTHFKKTLHDAGLGNIPANVPLLCLAVGDQAEIAQPDRPSQYNFGGIELSQDEIIEWTESLQEIINDAADDPTLAGWFSNDYIQQLGQSVQQPTQGLRNQRILGRLALIQDLRKGEASQIEQKLSQLTERALDDGRLTVIIVADMSDDIGSGSALDIAYICRAIQEQNPEIRNINLIAHLMTDRVEPAQNIAHQQVNAAAFLRELSRFQLSPNCPVPMYYGEGIRFNGVNQAVLFDEVYVYDNQPHPINGNNAATGLYAVVADSVSLWLDKGATQQLLSRQNALSDSRQQQLLRQSLIVSSLGIRQYRLPVADILEDVTLNYVRAAIQVFIAGQLSSPNDNRLPEIINYRATAERFTNHNEETPRQIAQAFLQEQFGMPSRFSKRWHQFWRKLVGYTSNNSNENRYLNKDLSQLIKNTKVNKNDIDIWQIWLQSMVLLLLNGQADDITQSRETNYIIKRAGKLGLAQDFLAALCDDSLPEGGILQNYQRQVNETNSDIDIEDQLQRFIEYTQQVYSFVRQLLLDLATGNKKQALFNRLIRQAGEFDYRKQQLESLLNREYIWEDQFGNRLVEKWYAPLKEQTDALIRRLSWRFEDNQLQLVLHLSADESIVYDKDNPQIFIDAMLTIGYDLAQPQWKQDSLFSIMRQRELNSVNLQNTVLDAHEQSKPVLVVPRQATNIPQVFVATNADSPQEQQQIARTIQNRLPSPELLKEIKTTDAFSFVIAQVIDGVELESTKQLTPDDIRSIMEQYALETGIENGVYDPATAIPTSIFQAEARALHYERQRQKHNVQRPDRRKRFTPLMVAMLAYPEHVESYVLALISGMVDIKFDENEQKLSINADNYQAELISDYYDTGDMGILLGGLLAYIKKTNLETATAVRHVLIEDADDFIEEWHEWITNDNGQSWQKLAQDDLQKAVAHDLADIARTKIQELT